MADVREQLQTALGSSYTLERELGGGGMSRTYLATERALNRRVVVKILAPELLANISVERFKREVLLAAQLQHPHVVPVLASGDADGLPWFTMPYVEGESLRMRLARGPLRISEVTGILKDVARALEFAHGHNVVHRDIKPDNVLLAGSSATVTDFGIAKAIAAARTDGGGSNSSLTMTGQSIGTPAYMAPEQAAGDPRADNRSDIYSYGAMAYELLAGRPPFMGSSPARTISAHFSEAPRPITELRADTPPLLAELVMRCLEKDVSRRPQTAGDLVRVLDAVTSSGASEAAPIALLGGQMRLGRALGWWALATLLVGLTAWAATGAIGLPDWVFPGSLGVMLAGLPVIAVTWYVQHTTRRAYSTTPAYTPGGTPSGHGTFATLALKASPHVSWRRTWLGGAVAVGAFVTLVVGFMVMRALGIGPAGSLMAAGKLGANESLVVADFRAPPGDSILGTTMAEALRTDLGQSSTLRVMTRASMREVLRLMQRPSEMNVDFALAREIATREGAKAVLDGEVVSLGGGYVISARLVSALDGSELATFRRTADVEGELINTLGKLSRDIRARTGESLKLIREARALERVTTSSLPALRKYVEGMRLTDEVGATERGLAVLEEAVAIDTTFAMAWRKIAVTVNNTGTDRARVIDAIARAYRHRERLSEPERLLTEAYYYSNGPEPSTDKALAAYEALIEADPANVPALNNAGVLHNRKREWQKGSQRYREAAEAARPFGGSYYNLAMNQARLGELRAAESTLTRFRERMPENALLWETEWQVRWGQREFHAADSLARAALRDGRRVEASYRAAERLAASALLRGRLREGVRWAGERHGVVWRATRAADRPLRAAIDSATALAAFGNGAQARGIVRAALARTRMSELQPLVRPWNEIGQLGALLRDSVLAREAELEFERDLPQLALEAPDAQRARMRAWTLMAAGRYAEAIPNLREADRNYTLPERMAVFALATAFDASGTADSAASYYERYLTTLEGNIPGLDGWFRATALRRAGEMAERRGEPAVAERHYAELVELWKDADPELQPTVRDIRDRLARLRRQRG